MNETIRLIISEDEFQERIEKWKTFNNIKEKQCFYNKYILPHSIKRYLQKSLPNKEEGYEHMILSLGTSFEPIVLSLSLWQPKNILFLCTKESEPLLDQVFEFFPLKPSQYNKAVVDSTKTLGVYKEIKKIYDIWERPENILVDPTGGTKAMTAATSIAGAVIKARMVYVGGGIYCKEERRPIPGTEYLEYIDDPIREFGDLEKEKAIDFFNSGSYQMAKHIFEKLEKNPYIDFSCPIYSLLSSGYEAWDNLELNRAYAYFDEIVNRINDYNKFNSKPLEVNTELIKNQKEVLGHITDGLEVLDSKEKTLYWLFAIYNSAIRRKDAGLYDMSSFLLYRLLELIMQARIMKYGLNTSNPDYNNIKALKIRKEEIEIKYSKVWRQVHKIKNNRDIILPNHITLMAGYILLYVFNDEIVGKNLGFLIELGMNKDLRNNNIYAHGFECLEENEYNKLLLFVEGVLKKYCECEGINQKDLSDKLQFIKI